LNGVRYPTDMTEWIDDPPPAPKKPNRPNDQTSITTYGNAWKRTSSLLPERLEHRLGCEASTTRPTPQRQKRKNVKQLFRDVVLMLIRKNSLYKKYPDMGSAWW